MRDSLTVLAILVIGVLTAALVGPYFIDWNAHRTLIENRLTAAAGTRVKVDGPIDLKLLPRPIFKFGHVSIGDAAPGRPHVTAEEVDTEISLAALTRGELQVVDTTIRRPRLALSEARDGGFGLPLPGATEADRVAFDHLSIREGAVAVEFRDGRHLDLSGLDLDAEATSLRGPFKATGQFGPAEAPLPFRFAAGVFDGRKVTVKLRLDGTALRPSLDLDGVLTAGPPAQPTTPGPPARPTTAGAGFKGPGFDGTAAFAGQLPLAAAPAAVPWRMTAHLTADPDHAAASDIELRAGTDMRAMIATGNGAAGFATASQAGDAQPMPSASVQLHGAQLDLDRLATVPDGATVAPPRGADLVRQLLDLAGNGTAMVGWPLRLAVSAGFDTATLDGQTLLGTRSSIALGPEGSAGIGFSTEGPDGARLSLDGRLEPGSAAVFRGRADVATSNLPRTTALIASVAPDLAAWFKGATQARTVAATGDLEVTSIGAAVRNLSLRLDDSRLDGALSYTRGVGTERPRLSADLASANLDLDALPDLPAAVSAARDIDLSLSLSAKAVRISAGNAGTFDAGHAAMHVTKTGDDLDLDRLALDVGGSSIEATAQRTGQNARAEARIRAPDLAPLAAALARLFPQAGLALLRDRAATLSPFDGTVVAEATSSADGTLAPRRFTLDGTAAGTRVTASLAPDRPDDGLDAAARPVTLSLEAEAPDGSRLLRQLGLSETAATTSAGVAATPQDTALPGIGAGRLDGTARGSWAGGFDGTLAATLGVTTLSYQGRTRVERGQGHVAIRSTDLRPVLSDFGVGATAGALSGMADGVPADIEGELGWNGSVSTLHRLSGRVGGASLSGDLSLDLAPRKPGTHDDRPVLFGQLALDRLPARTLLALAWGNPGRADGASDADWSDTPFGPAVAALPRTEIGLRISTVPVFGGAEASALSLVLRAEPGALTLADATGRFDGGTIGGTLALRRDGSVASLSGRVTWNDVPFRHDGLSARTGGTQDLAGSGESASALVASLAGTGSLTLGDTTIARTDPDAVARTVVTLDKAQDAADPDTGGLDVGDVRQALSAELDRASLVLGNQTAPAILASGVLRAGPLHAEGPRWAADSELVLDLGRLDLTTRTRLRARDAKSDRKAETADVVSILSGRLDASPQRDLDVTSFVNLVQARAIARAQERIEVIQQDVRERAFFNRRLKAIESDQQAARARARAEAEDAAAAKAEAAANARVEAAAAKAEADKQRFIDNAVKGVDGMAARPRSGPPALRPDARQAPPGNRARSGRNGDPFDLKPPPDIQPNLPAARSTTDPSSAGRY